MERAAERPTEMNNEKDDGEGKGGHNVRCQKSARDFHHPYGEGAYGIQVRLMNAVYDCVEEGGVGVFESPTDPDEPDWMADHARAQKKKLALQRKADMNDRLAKIRAKEERARQRYESGEPAQKRQKTAAASEDIDEAAFALDDYESEEENRARPQPGASSEIGLSAETQALIEKLGGSLSTRKQDDNDELEDELKIFFCSRTHSQLSQFARELRRVKVPPAIAPDDDRHQYQGEKADALAEEAKYLSLGSRKNLCVNDQVSRLGNATAINERCLELQQSGTAKDKKCKYLPNKENEALVNDFRDHALAKVRDIEDLGKLGKRIGICPYYASRAAIKPSEIVTLPYPLLLQKSAREALNLNLKGHIVIIDEAHNLMDAIANIHSVSITLSQLKQSRSKLGVYLQKFRNRLKGKNRVYVTQLVRLLDSLAGYLGTKIEDTSVTEAQVHVADLLAGKGVDQINLYKLMRYLQESKLARKVEGYQNFAEEQERQEKQKSHGPSSSKVNTAAENKAASMPVLMHLQSFLLALTYPSAEGRFFYSKMAATGDSGSSISNPRGGGGGGNIVLKYLLLDTTHHFKEIVDDARAVILAGGTMSPIDDYTQHLFHYLPQSRVQTLSCGHVIPKSNLIAAPVVKGPGGVEFDFTFEKRKSEVMINDLGNALIHFSSVIPDGIVVFFPSYSYLSSAVSCWQKNFYTGNVSGATSAQSSSSSKSKDKTTIWQALSSIKKIFMEQNAHACSSNATSTSSAAAPSSSETTYANTAKPPAQPNSAAESILTAYTSHLHSSHPRSNSSSIVGNSPSGAILLAVLSGTLSEGINFADALGRGIVVVGLPFPNPRDGVWRAKLEYHSAPRPSTRDVVASDTPLTPALASSASVNTTTAEKEKHKEKRQRSYTEAQVMRSINQSIGRAIRHKNDHAAILLLDRRWTAPGGRGESLRGKLPAWIAGSLFLGGGGVGMGSFEGVEESVMEFFAEKERGKGMSSG
ncbi:MAG: ATP-dependent DNA helicase chl1 [Alyxoria varia]|nr:MAG: ATP-dependent DNA helicase chl1 [Alyxoria varia]